MSSATRLQRRWQLLLSGFSTWSGWQTESSPWALPSSPWALPPLLWLVPSPSARPAWANTCTVHSSRDYDTGRLHVDNTGPQGSAWSSPRHSTASLVISRSSASLGRCKSTDSPEMIIPSLLPLVKYEMAVAVDIVVPVTLRGHLTTYVCFIICGNDKQ